MKMDLRQVQNAMEQRFQLRSLRGQTIMNATGDTIDMSSVGYQIALDTLTWIKKQIIEQVFYQVSISDYVDIAIGEGAFAQAILQNIVLNTSGDFEQGNIGQGIANDRLSQAGAARSSRTIQVMNWAKGIGYSIFEIQQALQASNWDYIASLHEARKENWDLGIQMIAFLGSLGDNSSFPGLLTLSNVNSNTSLITSGTGLISAMSVADFNTLVAGLIEAFRANCNRTAYPNTFVMPEDDYNGLGAMVTTAGYSAVSKMDYLKKAFDQMIPGGLKILPSAYAIPAQNASRGLNSDSGFHRYLLYRKDPKTVRMDIPVDITVTQPNTLNNFQFQDAAYGQYTGVAAYRPLELLYFDRA